MKIAHSAKRAYRQGARADAAAETGRVILAAFREMSQTRWYDEITLDAVAREAGVTVQTVIRRFGGKDGLLDETFERMSSEIKARRVPEAGGVEAGVDSVVEDYELAGDAILRMLVQEPRWPALAAVLEKGRAGHRNWVTSAFSSELEGSPARRRECIDGLVIATDVYTWKLLRRDMGRSVKATKRMMLRLVRGVLEEKAEDAHE